MLLVDVSGSMAAKDVRPNRLAAAVAAMGTLVDRLPPRVEVGVVAFSSSVTTVVAPTRDRGRIRTALAQLRPQSGTALGDGLAEATSLVVTTLGDEGVHRGTARLPPGRDRARVRRRPEPRARAAGTAAARAKAAGVRVYGVALGTPAGAIEFNAGIHPTRVPVPPDDRTVSAIARVTGGEAYPAQTAARAQQVYAMLADTLAGSRHS